MWRALHFEWKIMPVSLRFEHRRDPNILHTWFEEGSVVSSYEDIRYIRDRLLHAVLDCPPEAIWVMSLDHIHVDEQWSKSFEELLEQARAEGIKSVVTYSGPGKVGGHFHWKSAAGVTTCSSKEEALSKAQELH
ncbi:MAG: hypothetical protein PHX83_09585 [Acidobacteriia bacterium]|nr:hypothetical protein [Terriglobia bacterium]